MTRRMWALLSLLSTTVTGSSSTPPRLLPSSLPSLYLPPALSLEAYVKPSSSIPHWNEKILNFLRARRRQQKKENTILEASFIATLAFTRNDRFRTNNTHLRGQHQLPADHVRCEYSRAVVQIRIHRAMPVSPGANQTMSFP